MGSNSDGSGREASGSTDLLGPDGALRRRPPAETLEWARRAVGDRSRLLAVETLTGGISHANHGLDIADDGGTIHRLVLRRWARPGWEVTDPEYTPEQEIATYGLLATSMVPAPRLVAADPRGEACDVPAILVTRLDGTPGGEWHEEPSFVGQLAAALPAVHSVDPDAARSLVPPYLPYYDPAGIRPPAWATGPRAWERAIEISTGPEPAVPATFIHRDYHPENTIWRDGRLVGIVDWTSAAWGPPPIDVAHMRANLTADIGVDAADAFLAAYRSLDGSVAYDPFWDVRGVVDFISDLDTEGHLLGQLEDLVARAVADLG
jgi:aminoglycoside phosphotransferase (APT) family kinase protein